MNKIYLVLARIILWLEKKWPGFFPAVDATSDIYAGSMTRYFNWLHRLIYPRFFKKISIESENLGKIRETAITATIIYVTKDIGQLEYNFFNYLFLKEGLPLASFVNGLSLWQWLPFKTLKNIVLERARRFADYGPLPHPISSGYAGALIENARSVFFQLKSTPIFDDLYWYSVEKDPLAALLAALERETRPIYVVPLHFIWDKRPEGTGSLVNLLPRCLRKNILFWRNYKNRAVVKVSEPIRLSEFAFEFKDVPLAGRARRLRGGLLDLLHQEKKATTGPALKPRSWIIEELLEDESLQKVFYDVSAELKKPVDDVKALARKYIVQTAADINYNYVEIACKMMKWAIKNIYDGVVINQDGITRLKKARHAPIILVPNHRSHMDYLILSAILYENNIAIPHVAAGVNLAFWPIGHIFKKCGAFFLRRTFSGNRLYREVFKTYLKILLKEGYCQEFFIEGSRSRTGKLLRPRRGMPTMLIEALREGSVGEVVFVPVAIAYDQIIEEYKKEVEGGQKRSERLLDLLNLRKYLRRKYGRIYVNFGEPVLYKDEGKDIASVVRGIEGLLMTKINRETTVTPSALAATTILSNRRGITRDEMLHNAGQVMDYLKWKGASFSEGLKSDPPAAITDAVEQFIRAGYVELHDEFVPIFYEIKEDSRIVLDYYKNNIIHFFVSASSVASIVLAHIRQFGVYPPFEALKDDYLFCKKLFAFEFAFSTRMDVDEHIKKILHYFEGQGGGTASLEVYKEILAPYFEAYLIAAIAIQNLNQVEERALLKRMMRLGRHLHLLGRILNVTAISSPTLKNAILGMGGLGVLVQNKDQKGRKIYSWSGNVELAGKVKLKLEGLC
ncbi:MAG: hypothetical protein A3I09_03205 [Deltaproteobacteria bacterium RIFCSPLOWO2_02_FULL_47_10]|nr:MAG: hypothetical protein A3I09_03205 [Deltaproteobacteria bacterium RIFCSPLOWO2_02_FULL_47_10]